ncbi:MAG: hypothetical protein O7G84_01235 [Gammaproteobacteria bacterium]|nr:hypothetical protein [Gammaproteobacteria bacterium]
MVVKVDIGQISLAVLGMLPTRSDQERMVHGMGAAALAFWKRQAQQNLKSTSREYVQALTSEEGDRKFTITLSGVLPNLIEQGFQGGDMRDWMLSGPKAKQGKNGKYLIIPFSHGAAGSSGRNTGPAMPVSIHAAAKRLAPSLSRPARGTAAEAHKTRPGERLSAASAHVDRQAHKLLTTKAKPWHASSVYQGIVRQEKKYKRATQSSYTSFRVISENVNRGESDKEGKATQHWFHPGIRAVHFATKTQKHVGMITTQMFRASTKG